MNTLTELLRQATAHEVRAALSTPFAQRLARGELDRTHYMRLLANLQALYAELEWALMWNRQHPAVGPLCLPELWRNELLQDDLRTLLGPSWYSSAPRQDTVAQVERLGLLCDEAPALLAAHAWVLYATDLPGASQGGAGIARALGLRGKEGTVFLRYATHLDGASYRAHLLDTLDQLRLDERSREALAKEARLAVRGVHALFEVLGRNLTAAQERRERVKPGGWWLRPLALARGMS
ncbi:biliverdin-producing heme oxygenase [Archangium lansingense]|uniref:Biliverdin-producing heme oxygenase n=1 Tax=Archangium lansingense TaxID=2995310 RepID=A0ABT4A1H6_9BACT|nr:biliverdin-producing heme oxygenase [Archangium lansinium]MCY1075496.1 biliverdin-producing heme oxygenase [Archangium lansinium]